jgi:hypothetical protein
VSIMGTIVSGSEGNLDAEGAVALENSRMGYNCSPVARGGRGRGIDFEESNQGRSGPPRMRRCVITSIYGTSRS